MLHAGPISCLQGCIQPCATFEILLRNSLIHFDNRVGTQRSFDDRIDQFDRNRIDRILFDEMKFIRRGTQF